VRVLPYPEQKRQLFDYLEWINKQEAKGKVAKIGCRALKDFCIGEEKCIFKKKQLFLNRKAMEKPPFDFNEARAFLEKKYLGCGFKMYLVLKNLRGHQLDKGLAEIIFIGYKGLSTLIQENENHTLAASEVCQMMKELVNEGMVEILIRGKRGSFSTESNGYRLLPWKAPQPTGIAKLPETN
jgi:hypothetical protein